MIQNPMKRVCLTIAALLAPVALIGGSVGAQTPPNAQDNTRKVNSDISKAVSTLDQMQRLGRQIDSMHRSELARSNRSVRSSSVRTASQTDTTVTKKPAKKASKTKTPKKKPVQ